MFMMTSARLVSVELRWSVYYYNQLTNKFMSATIQNENAENIAGVDELSLEQLLMFGMIEPPKFIMCCDASS